MHTMSANAESEVLGARIFMTKQRDELTAPEQPPIECSTVSAMSSRHWWGTLLGSWLLCSICSTAKPAKHKSFT